MWWPTNRHKPEAPGSPWTPALRDLWHQVESFPFDATTRSEGFPQRLASDQGWKQEFADRVILEYRRFMFLTVASKTPVTPSHTVDEAWHLHLIYTRSYWEHFCLSALGRLTHHDPGSGGNGDKAFFARQYEQTLQTYFSFFGEPPIDIWGPHNGDNVRRLQQ